MICKLKQLGVSGTPLQSSCLENPMDGGAWWAAVHGVAKSRTRLSDFPFTFHFHALEKEMATHSSVLAWRIPGTGDPGGLQSMGYHRVGHHWSDLAAAAAAAAAVDFNRTSVGSEILKSFLSQLLFSQVSGVIGTSLLSNVLFIYSFVICSLSSYQHAF